MAFTSICYFLQLLSETVAKALVLSGDPAVQETAKFVTMSDKFFDALNVSNYTSGVNKRKVFQQPYRSGDEGQSILTYAQLDMLLFLTVAKRGIFSFPRYLGAKCPGKTRFQC